MKGLICLSACLAGEVNQALLNGEMKSKEMALWHKKIYLEKITTRNSKQWNSKSKFLAIKISTTRKKIRYSISCN